MKDILVFTNLQSHNNERVTYAISILVDKSPLFGLPPFHIRTKKGTELDYYSLSQQVILNIITLIAESKNASLDTSLTIFIKYNPVCFDWKQQLLSSENCVYESYWKKISSMIEKNNIRLTLDANSFLNEV